MTLPRRSEARSGYAFVPAVDEAAFRIWVMAPSRDTHYSRQRAFVARHCGSVRPAGLCVNNDRDTSGRTFAGARARAPRDESTDGDSAAALINCLACARLIRHHLPIFPRFERFPSTLHVPANSISLSPPPANRSIVGAAYLDSVRLRADTASVHNARNVFPHVSRRQ